MNNGGENGRKYNVPVLFLYKNLLIWLFSVKKLRRIVFNMYLCGETTKKTVMLIKFAVKNFRGFAERIEWDLSQPNNYSFNTYAIKDGVIKNGIIYGPNGSGKTNFSVALFDIVNHLTQKSKKPDDYQNFVFGGDANLLVDFEYTFKFGEPEVRYDYSKARDGKLINEKLVVDGNVVFDHQGKNLIIDTKDRKSVV